MVPDIIRMIYVGEMPWHGLGARLPARASHEEIVQAAGFFEAVEKDVSSRRSAPPSPTARRSCAASRVPPGTDVWTTDE